MVIFFHLASSLSHRRLWVAPQVGGPDVPVPAGRVDGGEGLVGLQRPHTLSVDVVGSKAPLLAQRPQLDGPVRAARYALEEEINGKKEGSSSFWRAVLRVYF